MTITTVKFERLSVISSKSFEGVVAAIKSAVGHPEMMAKHVPDAGSYAPITILVDERKDGVHLSYDRKGSLDIVFANAGVAKYAPLGQITEEFYDSIFDINVKGLLFTVQKVLPLMPDGASIILNASVVASKGLAANSVYSATKAAIRSFARTWTTDLKHRHIRVNAVSPGSTDTPGLNELLASTETGGEPIQLVLNAVLLGRRG